MPPGFHENYPDSPANVELPPWFLDERRQRMLKSWNRFGKRNPSPKGSTWIHDLGRDEVRSILLGLGAPARWVDPWSEVRMKVRLADHLYKGVPLPGVPNKKPPISYEEARRRAVKFTQSKRAERKRWDRRMWSMTPRQYEDWLAMRRNHKRAERERKVRVGEAGSSTE